MTTTTVTETLVQADDTPAVGVAVLVKVMASVTDPDAPAYGNGVTYITAGSAVTNGSGIWSMDLQPNSERTPAGTVYLVYYKTELGERTKVAIIVPVSATPVAVGDILTTLPSDLPDPGAINAELGGDLSGTIGDATINADALSDILDTSPPGTVPVPAGSKLLGAEAGALVEWDVSIFGGGDVVGPASSVTARIATFNGTTGKLLQDGGSTIANVLARANHTGTQTASTVSDFDTQVRTSRIDQMAVPTSALAWSVDITLTATNGLTVVDGNAAHGKVSVGVGGLQSAMSFYGNTADTQGALVIGSALGLRLGPGGSTVADFTITRTGTAAGTITGALTVTGQTIVPDATGATAAMNRQTGDARYGVADASSVEVSSSVLRVKAAGVTNAMLAGSIANTKLATDPLARANHTGTQLASTVSDFDTQVRTSRIDQMAVPTSALSWTVDLTVTSANGVVIADGTSGHGKATVACGIFGAIISAHAATGDTQAAIVIGPNFGFRQGPGGSTAADFILQRTGTAAGSLTGDLTVVGNLTLSAKNLITDTTTGMQIGTGATQKLVFFGGTPIVRPSSTTDLRAALINLGLYTTGGATPLDLNGGALANGTQTFTDATNMVVGSTTGTKIATAVTQKLGFWNVTPVVQPAGASQAAVAVTGSTSTTPFGYTTAAQADAIVTLVNALRTALVNSGLIKGAA